LFTHVFDVIGVAYGTQLVRLTKNLVTFVVNTLLLLG